MGRIAYSLTVEDAQALQPTQPYSNQQPPQGGANGTNGASGPGVEPKNLKLHRLKRYDIFCIIVQRMIGTGIFSTPTTILTLTQNIGVSLLFWGVGAIIALGSAVIYLDYASAIPRVPYGPPPGKRHLPMNGGELIYLTHPFPSSELRFFISCVFGIIFVVLGNSAANCISFGQHFLRLCGYQVVTTQPHQWAVTGVAIAASTLVCFLHATWREWGMRLNNFFATIKMLMLVFIILLGFIYRGPSSSQGASLAPDRSFKYAKSDSVWQNYATAMLDVVFAYGGWNQANYVFGEAGLSPRAFRWTVLSAIFSVSILYLLVNVAYIYVNRWPLINTDSLDYTVQEFFKNTLGSLDSAPRVETLVNFMLAFSSFGNVIVTTFTSARVKQEVAKEGIFLYEKSIHIVRSWSVGDKLFRYLARSRPHLVRELPARDPNHASHGPMAQSPTPALILHCVFAVALILLSTVASPKAAYSTILGIYTYLIDIFIPLILAISLIHLRRLGKEALHRTAIPLWVSLPCAGLVIPAYAYIIVMVWVPHDPGAQVPFFVVPVVAVSVIFVGSAYWFSMWLYRQLSSAQATQHFRISRTPTVKAQDFGIMLVSDGVRLEWQPGAGTAVQMNAMAPQGPQRRRSALDDLENVANNS